MLQTREFNKYLGRSVYRLKTRKQDDSDAYCRLGTLDILFSDRQAIDDGYLSLDFHGCGGYTIRTCAGDKLHCSFS